MLRYRPKVNQVEFIHDLKEKIFIFLISLICIYFPLLISAFSPLKLKKIQRSLENSMKSVLEIAENLVPQKIYDFYMFDEKNTECVLLDEAAGDESIEKNWYLLVLFHQATDSFLHLVCSEEDLFIPTKNKYFKSLQSYIKYALGIVYPVIYSYTLLLAVLEVLTFCFPKTSSKIRQHRQNWEEKFDDTSILNWIHWCANLWFFVILVLYIISHFGAGFINWDACYCDSDHTWPTDWKSQVVNAGWLPSDSDLKTNAQCNTDLLNSLYWIQCQNETTGFTQVHGKCVGDEHGDSKYPHKLLANEFWTEKEWNENPNVEILTDVPAYVNNFRNSRYGNCEFYQFMHQLRTVNVGDYDRFLGNRKNKVFNTTANEFFGTESDRLNALFESYRWMFKTENFKDSLIHNSTATLLLLIYLFVFIMCKIFNEVTTYYQVNCSWAKYCVDKVNMIDVVQCICMVGYIICEYFAFKNNILQTASDSYVSYEVASRMFEMFSVITTILILMSIFPKMNMYTCEINSVIDMIFYGIRYLIVLTLLFMGFWFIGQNLFRRAHENNRILGIKNADYAFENVISNDLPFTSVDTLSKLLRAPFGIMTVPNEVYSYSAENRNDPNFDHGNITPLMVFWVIFFVFVVLIGFNGMVAFMTANLKIGNFEEQLEEKLMPSNIMRYNLSKLQPKYAFWPNPFSFLQMLHEMYYTCQKWIQVKYFGKESESVIPPLERPISAATKSVLTETVIECVMHAHGIEFEASSGRNVLEIVRKIQKNPDHPAHNSVYLKYLRERYDVPQSKDEREVYLEDLCKKNGVEVE